MGIDTKKEQVGSHFRRRSLSSPILQRDNALSTQLIQDLERLNFPGSSDVTAFPRDARRQSRELLTCYLRQKCVFFAEINKAVVWESDYLTPPRDVGDDWGIPRNDTFIFSVCLERNNCLLNIYVEGGGKSHLESDKTKRPNFARSQKLLSL